MGQPDTNENARSKAVAHRTRLGARIEALKAEMGKHEARMEELKAEMGKHEFALREIDQLISALPSPATPVRPPAMPTLQARSQPAAKKKAPAKHAGKKVVKK